MQKTGMIEDCFAGGGFSADKIYIEICLQYGSPLLVNTKAEGQRRGRQF